jgi:integrase/recombinase XerC
MRSLAERRFNLQSCEEQQTIAIKTGRGCEMNSQSCAWVDRFHRYLQTERRVSPHTSSAYALDVAALVAFCDRSGLNDWPDVKPSDVRTFAARSYARGLSPLSVRRRLAAVRTFMRFLVRERAVEGDPTVGIMPPRAGRHLPRVLDVDQMGRLLDIHEDDALAVRDKAIMELLFSSALRVAELVQLNCFDLDFAGGMVKVLGKGNTERIVPVGSYALTALRDWLQRRVKIAQADEPALFVGRWGGRLRVRNVQTRIAYWARRQSIEIHVYPHVFRHACATHVLERCRDLRAVQELLGHVSISTTAIYTHMDFEYLARVYRAAHPRAARRTICHIWAKRSDVAIPRTWLADAANSEWHGPPAVQMELFRCLDNLLPSPEQRQ